MMLLRLALDLLAACLLVFGFAYWWLGNGVHELAGTAMFLLLISHNVINRRWYGAIPRTGRQTRGLINIVLTLALMIAMLILLGTSIVISQALSGIMSPISGFTLRRMHTFAAYWALILVAIHLGLRWPTVMAVARGILGISTPNTLRTTALRLVAAAIAVHGVWSSFELGVGTKLAMVMTLDWWNFEESVVGFFVHCAAIMGLYIFLTYYAMKLIQRAGSGRRKPA